nr:hypothetical protein CFP56_30957 [Quercus suber]
MFAFHDGIIDSPDKDGSITFDAVAAYAILMTDKEEISGADPDRFTYRAKDQGRGRYKLTACTRDSRVPLMCDTRRHKVTGFTISKNKLTKAVMYDVHFKKVVSDEGSADTDLESLLMRPWSDEVDDYKEYKRLRLLARAVETRAKDTSGSELSPVSATSTEATALPIAPSMKTVGRKDRHSSLEVGSSPLKERTSLALPG